MTSFVQESLATIRRRLGYLIFRNRFIYGQISAASVSTVTLAKAIREPSGKLTGNTLYVIDGPAVGTLTTVSGNEQGTGIISVSPTFAVQPVSPNTVEIWPEGLDPDQVNQFLNMALLNAQDLSPVLVKATPTIASDRLSVTAPGTFNKIARLTYRLGDNSRVTLRPRGPLDPTRSDLVFTVNDTTLELDYAIPSDASAVQVIGYRPPAFLVNDTDLAEVRSDYLMFRAAALLATAVAKGPSIDPESHSAQALTWQRLADEIKADMPMQHLSNTHLIETVF